MDIPCSDPNPLSLSEHTPQVPPPHSRPPPSPTSPPMPSCPTTVDSECLQHSRPDGTLPRSLNESPGSRGPSRRESPASPTLKSKVPESGMDNNCRLSTPPPSPPLLTNDPRSSPHEAESASNPSSAVVYTSRELDIAYSMVTSTQQQEQRQQQPEHPQKHHRTHRAPDRSRESRPTSGDTDVLSNLLKSGPNQEPHFATRHTIASQHTLSTAGGVLFSLDEEPLEFNKDMYVAMRNRIFELESKTANYAPFSRARKRTMEEHYPLYEHGYGHSYNHEHGTEPIQYPKRQAYRNRAYTQHHPFHTHPHLLPPEQMEGITSHRYPRSYPSWYTPEIYMSEGYHQQFHVPHPTAIHHERTQHQSHRAKPIAIVPRPSNHQAAAGGVSRPSHTVHTPHESNCPKPSNPSQPTTNATAQQQQQQQPSFHQRQHRAQQQAQSDYSRNYHLQRHLRMLDQQRAAQMAQKQQQQQQQQQSPRIQRQYEPHQLMRPVPSSVPATKPPLQPLERQQPHHLSAQRQLIQSYRQQLQTAQQRPSGNSVLVSDIARMLASSLPRTLIGGPDNGGNLEDSSHKKSERPSECSNCMALEQVNCIPRNSQDTLTRTNGKLLCSTCIQYLQSHGKARPVPPFRVNFLKKIHCRVKRELREVRFRGWQDAQVLQVEDQMTQDDFRAVFHAGVEEGLVITGSSNDPRPTPSTVSVSEPNGSVVIKIEDDDDALDKPSDQPETEVRVFSSETSVNALFGHQWIAEPMIGYTVVHFGGSARTCVVPMNPTIPTLNVTFNRVSGAVVFEFKILVNGLCLPSSGGGPPAMHMPVTQEDEDPEGDQEMEEPAKEGAEEQVAVTAGSAAENTSHEPTNE